MRTGQRFCRVCLEQMIRRMYASVPPIDATLPAKYALTLAENEKQNFSARLNATQTGRIALEWYVDGVLKTKNITSFTPALRPGEHEVMLRAIALNGAVLRDYGLLESSVFWKVTVKPGGLPTIEAPPRPLIMKGGEELKYTVKAAPGKGGAALTYKVEGAPDGLKIDARTGEITWTPQAAQTGGHIMTVTADDGADKVSAQILIGVQSGESNKNRMPVIQYIPVRDAAKGDLIEFQVHADDLDGNAVVYNLKNPPLGATLDRATGKFHWRPNFSQAGEYELEFEAWDGWTTDAWKASVIVADALFGASDIAAARKDIAAGEHDAFRAAFYALRSKSAGVRQQGIEMLNKEGAKSSAAELVRLVRDQDSFVASAAGGALLALIKDKMTPDDGAYFALIISDIDRTALQVEDDGKRVDILKDAVTAVSEKTTDKALKKKAEILLNALTKLKH